MSPPLPDRLIDVDDCLLIVIDVQESFLQKLPEAEREILVNRIGWLVQVAGKLGVPIIGAAEACELIIEAKAQRRGEIKIFAPFAPSRLCV